MQDILDKMVLECGIPLDDFPELDLYMDQVIQLFESSMSPLKRNKEEKVLTKTMINNYAKGKLLFPINNKKYSKEHLILMAFIYNLKGALSINDIKCSLNNLIEKYGEDENYPLRDLYCSYLENCKSDAEEFKENVSKKIDKITNDANLNSSNDSDYQKKFLLLCSLVDMSNMYRRMSEKLIDEFFTEQESNK